MTPKVLYCYEDDSIEAVAENLAKNQVFRLPVMNKEKRAVGVISLGDLGRQKQKEAISTALCGIMEQKFKV